MILVWAEDSWLQKHAGATLIEEQEKAETEGSEKASNQTQVSTNQIQTFVKLLSFVYIDRTLY